MDTLQIQDAFEPYYAGKQPAPEPEPVRSHDRAAAMSQPDAIADRRARFDKINRRFGRTRRPGGQTSRKG